MSAQAAFQIIMPTANDAPLFAVRENAEVAVQIIQQLRAGRLFRLYAYAVLPDHLRLLLRPEPGKTLKDALKSLRGGIARMLASRGIAGPVWMPRSELRRIWNQDLLQAAAKEVAAAPATIGLTPNPESFLFCSACPEAEVDEVETAGAPAQFPAKSAALA